MQITLLGLLIIPLTLFWSGNPVRLLQTALVSAVFGAGCALIVGGNFGLPVAMIPGQMLIVYVVCQYALGMRYGAEGLVLRTLRPLIALVAYAVLSIMLFPDAFGGLVMVYPQRGDAFGYGAIPLAFNAGNITQTLYLVMNTTSAIVVAIFLTRVAFPYEAIIRSYLLGGYIVVGLSLWQFTSRIAAVPFPSDLLYSNPSYAIVEQAFGAVPRIQGPFSEPAALASYLSGLCFCCLWLTAHGHRVMRVSLLLGLSVLTMLLSTSTTGIVSLAVGFPLILTFAAAQADRRALARLAQTSAVLLVGALIAIGPVLILKPDLVASMNVVVEATLSKGESDSYNDRTGTDISALETIGPTYGLGVGWGGFRSSSLIPGLLANGGLFGIGMVLWLAVRITFLVSQAKIGARRHPGQSLVDGFAAAMCGNLTAAVLSSPTIDSLAFYLQLGCLVGTSARMTRDTRAVHHTRKLVVPLWTAKD